MNNKILDFFGEILMEKVRDLSIVQWEKTIKGEAKSENSKKLHSLISASGQSELIKNLVPEIVDTTIHNLLWMLEQEEIIDVTINVDDDGKQASLKDISDGLAGELYTEDGWIYRFSKKDK